MITINTPEIIKSIAKDAGYKVHKVYQKFTKAPFDENNYQTFDVFNRVLKPNSNCIDIGANKGDILKKIVQISPQGRHFAFEPIPDLFKYLERKFRGKVTIYNYALSNTTNESEFHYFKNRPAISGLIKRNLDKDYECLPIKVKTELLDNIIPPDIKIDLIKIDVEGAEYIVLQGSRLIIDKYKPYILFEFGYGSGSLYNTTPEMIFEFMKEMGMELSLLSYFLMGRAALSKEEFCGQYYKAYNIFFIAYDSKKITN